MQSATQPLEDAIAQLLLTGADTQVEATKSRLEIDALRRELLQTGTELERLRTKEAALDSATAAVATTVASNAALDLHYSAALSTADAALEALREHHDAVLKERAAEREASAAEIASLTQGRQAAAAVLAERTAALTSERAKTRALQAEVASSTKLIGTLRGDVDRVGGKLDDATLQLGVAEEERARATAALASLTQKHERLLDLIRKQQAAARPAAAAVAAAAPPSSAAAAAGSAAAGAQQQTARSRDSSKGGSSGRR